MQHDDAGKHTHLEGSKSSSLASLPKAAVLLVRFPLYAGPCRAMSARSLDFASFAILHKPQSVAADALLAARHRWLRSKQALSKAAEQVPSLAKADLLPIFAANTVPGKTDLTLALLAGPIG